MFIKTVVKGRVNFHLLIIFRFTIISSVIRKNTVLVANKNTEL